MSPQPRFASVSNSRTACVGKEGPVSSRSSVALIGKGSLDEGILGAMRPVLGLNITSPRAFDRPLPLDRRSIELDLLGKRRSA